MKATLYSHDGKQKGTVELPAFFATKIREDIVQKYFEADKLIQPYASLARAGLRQSGMGTISHKRHDWKGHYGKGISRAPRKTMWRRGTQFFWVGANAPGTRGGRRAHPPLGVGTEKKFNKKEVKIAMDCGFAATASTDFVTRRYSTMNKIASVPFVVESLPEKTKALRTMISEIFGDNSKLAFKTKEVRAGKGKTRGRRYKSNAGVLILTAKDEKAKFKGFDIKPVSEVSIADLYPLGRLTLYTKKAIDELSKPTEAKK